MRGKPFPARLMAGGLRRPKPGFRAGVDLAGEVEAVGKSVTQFREGDEVFGACSGAFAEYTCAKPERLARKPSNISFEEAAGVPIAATSALQGLRNVGRIRPGYKVLVEGASGGVGTFAIQLAKELGAEVTAVTSTSKVETARSLGAAHVLDYTRNDFTKSGELYDLILGANAYRPLSDYPRALKPDGVFVLVGGGGSGLLQAALLGLVGRKTRLLMGKASHPDLIFLAGLLEAGRIKTVIDRRYALAETAEAVRYVEQGHARGKVIISMESGVS